MSGYDQLQERLQKVEFTKCAQTTREVFDRWRHVNAAAIDSDGVVVFTAVNPALEIAYYRFERTKKVKTVFITKKFKLASGDTLKLKLGQTSNPDKFLKEVEEFVSNNTLPVIHDHEGFVKLLPKVIAYYNLPRLAKQRIINNDNDHSKCVSNWYSDPDVNWTVCAYNPAGKDDIVQAIVTAIMLHAKKCEVMYPSARIVNNTQCFDVDDMEFIMDVNTAIVKDGIDITLRQTITLLESVGSILTRIIEKPGFKCPPINRWDYAQNFSRNPLVDFDD